MGAARMESVQLELGERLLRQSKALGAFLDSKSGADD